MQPAKKQRIKISKNPLSFRPRARKSFIVIDGADESRGFVEITICEIPKGLLKDLKDDIEGGADELQENLNEETQLRLNYASSIKKAKENGVSAEDLFALKKGLKSTLDEEVKVLKARRKELYAEQDRDQLSVIRWGVCGHDEDYFDLSDELTDEEQVGSDAIEPFAFERGSEAFDGQNYLVAGPSVIQAYKSIGQPFLDALFYAIIAWQEGKYQPIEKVWKTTQDMLELNKRIIETKVKRAIEDSGLSKEDAEEIYAVTEGEANPLDVTPEKTT